MQRLTKKIGGDGNQIEIPFRSRVDVSDRLMGDEAHVREKLLEYSVSELLLNRLEPEQARDLLERIEGLVAKYEKDLQDKADGLLTS